MSAGIKETLIRLWRAEPPHSLGKQAPSHVAKASAGGIPIGNEVRLWDSPSYRRLLEQFVLPNSAQAVARSPYWKEVFSEPVRSILSRLKARGVLIEPIDPRARMHRDRDESDLRLLCVEHGLQPKGSAEELVDRLLGIDPTAWLLGYAGELLQCSEWAKKALFSRRGRAALRKGPTDNEVTWEMLKGRAQQTALEGNLAQCRDVHLAMAKHLLRRNKNPQALQALCVVCVFYLCGARNRSDVPVELRNSHSRFDPDRASLPPGLVRRLSILSREMQLSMTELRDIFLAIGTRLHLPESPRRLWLVLQAALEAESLSDGTAGLRAWNRSGGV
jgi:hypothetical protein